MPIKGKVGIVLLLLVLVGCGRLTAQPQRGEIKATIVDDQGSPLPGVTVSLKNVGCDCKSCLDPEKCECCPDEQASVSNAHGVVQFLVPVGHYSITAALEGFAEATVQVDVAIGAARSVEIQLSRSEG